MFNEPCWYVHVRRVSRSKGNGFTTRLEVNEVSRTSSSDLAMYEVTGCRKPDVIPVLVEYLQRSLSGSPTAMSVRTIWAITDMPPFTPTVADLLANDSDLTSEQAEFLVEFHYQSINEWAEDEDFRYESLSGEWYSNQQSQGWPGPDAADIYAELSRVMGKSE